MFALSNFMDSDNVKTTEICVGKERRLSDFDMGKQNHSIALQIGEFRERAKIEGAENLKHFCKICERRFACGRALGGHMRIHGDSEKSNPNGHMRIRGDSENLNLNGHMRIHGDCDRSNPNGHMRIHGDSENSNPNGHLRTHGDTQKSSPRGNHGDDGKSNSMVLRTEAANNEWCEVREQDGVDLTRTNRKRNWVLTEQSGALFTGMFEDDRLVGSSRACDECGKEFSSWNALLAHMKCRHSGNPEQMLEEEQRPVSERPAAKGKRSKRVKCPGECHSQYNEEEDMANCLVMLAMAGKKSPLEKPTEFKSKFNDKIDGFGVIQGKIEFPDGCTDMTDGMGVKAKFSDKIDGTVNKKYKCRSCQRVFASFQALGGHRASNHHYNCSAPSKMGNESSCLEEEVSTEGVQTYSVLSPEVRENGKGRRVHECSICERKFSSGQALGGHKRCHRTTTTSHVQETADQDKISLLPNYRGLLIDLNLPASCHYDQYEAERCSDKAAEPISSNLVNCFPSEIDLSKYLFPFYSHQWRIHKDGFLPLPEPKKTSHVVGPDDEAESIKREFD